MFVFFLAGNNRISGAENKCCDTKAGSHLSSVCGAKGSQAAHTILYKGRYPW